MQAKRIEHEKIAFFKTIQAFKTLTFSKLKIVIDLFRPLKKIRNSYLFREGDFVENVYLVQSGEFKVTKKVFHVKPKIDDITNLVKTDS